MTASDLTIRSFAPDDLPALQQIRQAAFGPVFQSFREIVGERISALGLADAEAEQAQHLDDLCRAGSAAQVFVAMLGDTIAGFFAVTMDTDKRIGEIGLNAVHPDHAGEGIGTRMYEYAIARMKEQGMALATVSTGGDASHAPARRAYEKAGFGPGLPSVYLYRVL